MLGQLARASGNKATRARSYATLGSKAHHKVVIVGGGTAGTTVAAQLRRSREAKDHLKAGDIAILDKADTHSYQPGWTLVGTGLRDMSAMRKPMVDVIPSGVQHYPMQVAQFSPENNSLQTAEGIDITYDYLVVAPGLKTNFNAVAGLEAAMADPKSMVSSIYSEHSAEQTWRNIQAFEGGNAIFTQPAGLFKCAGAPQKVLWMALSQWKMDGKREQTNPTFATGAPAMFAVPKYAKALEQLRVERNVEGLFQHSLVSVDAARKIATFKNLASGTDVERPYDLLHVVPPQGPHPFVATSALADAASGWVSVDQFTTQHTKFANVFSLGDASSLPNSKTAAAVTSQAPVLIDNLLATMRGEKDLKAKYHGYASCPLLTGHDELMLAEFRYGGQPQETFSSVMGSQDIPRKAFYHLKKDVFPSVYWNSFLKGTWFGPSTIFRPDTTKAP